MDTTISEQRASRRGRRALPLIALSLVVIVATAIAYLHPSLPSLSKASAPAKPAGPPLLSNDYLVAYDFLTTRLGWALVAEQASSSRAGRLVPATHRRTFDGGVPVFYSYATFVDAIPSTGLMAAATKNESGASAQFQAPNQVQLGSLDGGSTWSLIAPPSGPGAIGYSDAQNWWWIGSGAWSTSSDGGTTWTPYRNVGVVQPLPGSLQVLDADHAWFGAMAGTKGVLETTSDGGVHWQMIVLPAINFS